MSEVWLTCSDTSSTLERFRAIASVLYLVISFMKSAATYPSSLHKLEELR